MTTPTTPKSILRKLRVAEAINHAISVVSSANVEFWNRSTPEILDELNADIQETLAIFAGNTALNTALNASQETLNVTDENGLPVYTLRAPVEPGRSDIVFDGTGFVYTAPEPTAEIEL